MLTETIYTDNDHDTDLKLSDDSLSPDKSAKWGEYQVKPVSQETWEGLVKTTIAEITAEKPVLHRNYDLRPYVKDKLTNTWLLVDSGAAVSVWPSSKCDNPIMDPNVKLHAVNNSKIDTFGSKTVKLQLGNASYSQKVTVARVKHEILGWDKLDPPEQPAIVAPVQFDTFQKWSQNCSHQCPSLRRMPRS